MKRWIVVLSISLLSSCVSDEPKDPVNADPAFAGIDPDQKALPKEGSDQKQSSAVESMTSEASVTTAPASPEVQSAELPASPPPTPPVEQLAPIENTASKSVDQTMESETATVSGTSIGSGPQVRYIKAFELNIRSKPNRRSQIVGRLKGKDEVHVSIHGGWSKLDDGRWIRTRWLVKSPPDNLVSVPPDEEGKLSRKKKVRHKPGSKHKNRGSKS
jgi:hypothetical protein